MMSFLLMDESTILELRYAPELSLANIPGKGEHMCTLFSVL